MSVSQTQCFLIAMVITGAIGAFRGWAREVITCAIILGTVLFLANGGGNLLARWLGQSTSTASNDVVSGSGGSLFSTNAQLLSNLIFVGIVWLAYAVGSRYGAAPKTHNHRIAGILPGAITGAAIVYYVGNSILTGREVDVQSPSPGFAGTFLPEVIGFGLIGLLIVIFIAGQVTKK